MQDVKLENIKIELEDNKQLLMNNDISLIDCQSLALKSHSFL